MTNYTGMIPPVEIMDGYMEIVQDPYFQLEEISGITPLTDLQAEMLDPLARELARLIRERINCDELFISEDGVVCGKIEANI